MGQLAVFGPGDALTFAADQVQDSRRICFLAFKAGKLDPIQALRRD